MKALSIDPEYAWYIHDGEKTVECRTWKTNYRGPLLICASKIPVEGFISGHAICVANLVDVVPFTEEHVDAAMMEGMPDVQCYAWLLEDAQPIIPFPVRGKMGLFDVDTDSISYEQNERTESMTDDEYDVYVGKFYVAYEMPLIYMPGKKNDAYNIGIEYGKKLRENPDLLYDGSPIPPELLTEKEE